MSETDSNSLENKSSKEKSIQEQGLAKMEALLKQSAMGVHVLFQNHEIAQAMKEVKDQKDFYDFKKMKQVQDVMTELISKPTYFEKMSFLKDLDQESYQMLIRTYFHIVENTVRASTDHH